MSKTSLGSCRCGRFGANAGCMKTCARDRLSTRPQVERVCPVGIVPAKCRAAVDTIDEDQMPTLKCAVFLVGSSHWRYDESRLELNCTAADGIVVKRARELRCRGFNLCFAVGLGLMPLAQSAMAVIVADSTGNLMPPDDDPGFDNIGQLKGASAIYLGNRWVMTASHVGVGPVTFPSVGVFDVESGSVVRLTNPPAAGLSAMTDITMFRLVEDPGLPALQISPESPSPGTEALVIGNGLDREDSLTFWDVERRRGKWIWTESEEPADYSGYRTKLTASMRWGTNLIEDDEPFFFEFDKNHTTEITTAGDVIVLISEFDRAGQSNGSITGTNSLSWTEFESQAVLNDSGGALFHKSANGQWWLSGMIVSVDGHQDQPDETRNAVFGNLTFYADLASYRDQILQHYVSGDFNGDGYLTAIDIDLLSRAILNSDERSAFDVNSDGKLNQLDRRRWVQSLRGTYFGDANLDGEFDTSDLILVLQAGQYEDSISANSTWATGDWNGDLEFTSTDFIVALQDGGYENGPRSRDARSAAVVPEPLSLSLWLWLISGLPGALRSGHRPGKGPLGGDLTCCDK